MYNRLIQWYFIFIRINIVMLKQSPVLKNIAKLNVNLRYNVGKMVRDKIVLPVTLI